MGVVLGHKRVGNGLLLDSVRIDSEVISWMLSNSGSIRYGYLLELTEYYKCNTGNDLDTAKY